MGYFQGQTCSKGLFHCVIHSDRRGYHTKLSFYQNENKFDEQISSVSSKKPSFKTINAVTGSVQFQTDFNKPSSYYGRLTSLKRFFTILRGLSHEISDTFKLQIFMFTLMLYMNSRNEKKIGRVLFRLNEIKESMKLLFLKKWLLERKPSEWIAISLLQQSARPSNQQSINCSQLFY